MICCWEISKVHLIREMMALWQSREPLQIRLFGRGEEEDENGGKIFGIIEFKCFIETQNERCVCCQKQNLLSVSRGKISWVKINFECKKHECRKVRACVCVCVYDYMSGAGLMNPEQLIMQLFMVCMCLWENILLPFLWNPQAFEPCFPPFICCVLCSIAD